MNFLSSNHALRLTACLFFPFFQNLSAQPPATAPTPEPLTLQEMHQNVACFGEKSGSAMVFPSGGVAPVTLRWQDGSTADVLQNLPAGSYSVTATDATGATASLAVRIEQPASKIALTEKHHDLRNLGDSDGSIELTASGGTGRLTFLWENGSLSADRSGLTASLYSVTVADENHCKSTLSVTLTEPLAVMAMHQNVPCFGEKTGSAVLSAFGGIGPATFLWSDGSTADSRPGLAAGTYSVTATDASGKKASTSVTILQPATRLSVSENHTDPSAAGSNDGSISLSVQGGTGRASFLWADGSLSPVRSELPAGEYLVTVTDANRCFSTFSIRLGEPGRLMASGNEFLISSEPPQNRADADLVEPVVVSGFSPNKDGKYDTFVIEGLEKFASNELLVFGADGLPVFHRKDYDNSWDGKVQGRALPNGMYFYMLELTDGNTLSGYLAING